MTKEVVPDNGPMKACKFVGTPEIRVRIRIPEKVWTVCVRDNGDDVRLSLVGRPGTIFFKWFKGHLKEFPKSTMSVFVFDKEGDPIEMLVQSSA